MLERAHIQLVAEIARGWDRQRDAQRRARRGATVARAPDPDATTEPWLVLLHGEAREQKVLRLHAGPLERPVQHLHFARLHRPERGALRLRRFGHDGVVAPVVHRVRFYGPQAIAQAHDEHRSRGTQARDVTPHPEAIVVGPERVAHLDAGSTALGGEDQRGAVARDAYVALPRREAPIRERNRVRAEHEPLAKQWPVSRDELYGPSRVAGRK